MTKFLTFAAIVLMGLSSAYSPAPPRQTNGKAGCIEVKALICPATQGLF